MEGMVMSFEAVSYIMGHAKGEADAQGVVVIETGVTCTDDDGNITIEEEGE